VARFTVILNRKAGSAAEEATRRAIEASLAHAALDARIVAVTGPEIHDAANGAAAAGDALIAAGGDGTVSAVAGVAVKTGATFGVIPLGTLNHFAKDAGIPLDIDAAVQVLAAGRPVPLDTGTLNARTFVNNASIGLYARMVHERQVEERRGRRKWTAFAIAMARVWRSVPQITVRLTVDGRALVRRTPFVFVGNGDYQDAGLNLGRRASLTAGHLSIYLAPECGPLDMLMLGLRAVSGRLPADIKLEEFRACEVTIEPGARDVDVATDGELTRVRPPFTCEIRRGALRTLLPLT
jgi:diacylglycerol kinase family enzyme